MTGYTAAARMSSRDGSLADEILRRRHASRVLPSQARGLDIDIAEVVVEFPDGCFAIVARHAETCSADGLEGMDRAGVARQVGCGTKLVTCWLEFIVVQVCLRAAGVVDRAVTDIVRVNAAQGIVDKRARSRWLAEIDPAGTGLCGELGFVEVIKPVGFSGTRGSRV